MFEWKWTNSLPLPLECLKCVLGEWEKKLPPNQSLTGWETHRTLPPQEGTSRRTDVLTWIISPLLTSLIRFGQRLSVGNLSPKLTQPVRPVSVRRLSRHSHPGVMRGVLRACKNSVRCTLRGVYPVRVTRIELSTDDERSGYWRMPCSPASAERCDLVTELAKQLFCETISIWNMGTVRTSR